MTKMPRISIVTPSFNQGEFLEECIDSVLSQNYPDIEYIVIDGGSTDNSVEIIKKYEKYLSYWRTEPDQGQYDALNFGFQRTTGEIMAWLNSDDKFHPYAFYKVAFVLETCSEVAWLSGRPTIWNAEGRISYVWCDPLPVFTREKFLRKECFDPCIQQESTFWRRSLWELAGGCIRTDLALAGDLDLWVRCFRHAKLYCVDTLIGGHRKHQGQKTHRYMEQYMKEAAEILSEEMAHCQSKGEAPDSTSPAPILMQYERLNTFMEKSRGSNTTTIFKLSDQTDAVVDYLVERLRVGEADSAARLRVIDDLSDDIKSQHATIGSLNETIGSLNETIGSLNANIGNLNAMVGEINADRAARLEIINDLGARLLEADAKIFKQWQRMKSLEEDLNSLHRVYGEINASYQAVIKSSSWKLTRPVRWLMDKLRHSRS